MTRTEYCLDNMACVAAKMATAFIEEKYAETVNQERIRKAMIDLMALGFILQDEGVFGSEITDQQMDDELHLRKAQYQLQFEGIGVRKQKGKLYQLKESPLTDLPKFHEDLKKQFPEIAKRKALRVYESEKTEPFMDLLNSYLIVLQEVKT